MLKMWSKHTRSISNARDLEKIDLDRDKYNIYNIILYRLEDECFCKLLEITQWSPLVKLHLRDCIKTTEKLTEILAALVDNSAIKNGNLTLDLRGNAFDVTCVAEMKRLLSRKVLRSLNLPEGLDAVLLGEMLGEILDGSVELKELNISHSVLDPDCITLLEKILLDKLIKGKLGMIGCQGVAETTLTSNDKKKLSEAVTNSRGYFPFSLSGTPKIVWFTYVKHAEAPGERDGNYELIEVEDHIRPIFKGKLGQVEKVIRLIARDKERGDRQLLKTLRKRKHGDVVVPVEPKKIKEEIGLDALSDQFRRNTLDSADSVPRNVTSSPQSERDKHWSEMSASTSCSSTPTKSPITTGAFQPRRIYDEAYSPVNKAHGFCTDFPQQRSLGVPRSFAQGLQNSPAYQNLNRIHNNNLAEVYNNISTGNPVRHLQVEDILPPSSHRPIESFDRPDPPMTSYESPHLLDTPGYPPLTHDPQHHYHIQGQGASSTVQLNAFVSATAGIPFTPTPTTYPRPNHRNSSPRDGAKETQLRQQPPPRQCYYAPQPNYNFDRNAGYGHRIYTNDDPQSQVTIKNESQAKPKRGNNKGRWPRKRRSKKEKGLSAA